MTFEEWKEKQKTDLAAAKARLFVLRHSVPSAAPETPLPTVRVLPDDGTAQTQVVIVARTRDEVGRIIGAVHTAWLIEEEAHRQRQAAETREFLADSDIVLKRLEARLDAWTALTEDEREAVRRAEYEAETVPATVPWKTSP